MTTLHILTPSILDHILDTPEKSRVGLLAPLCKDRNPNLCSRWAKPFHGHFDEIIYLPVEPVADGENYNSIYSEATANLDGLLFPGGHSNVHPKFYKPYVTQENDLYDEARDHFAIHLIQQAEKHKVPALFICRGMQELGIRHKMVLELLEYGDFDHGEGYIHDGDHEKMDSLVHDITIVQGGILAKTFGQITRKVNSIHRYGFHRDRCNFPASLRLEATAPDGIVEAISTHDDLFLGFQPHPEFNFEGRNFWHNGIFGERIAKFKEKYIQRTGLTIAAKPEPAYH